MLGKRLAGGTSKGRISVSTKGLPEIIENAVIIPHIKLQDNARLLPKYTAALSRTKGEFLPAEDLDTVQLELELLLSNVAQRNRILKSEYDTIEREDRKDKKSKLIEKPPSPGKRKRADDKKSKDKLIPSLKIAKKKNNSLQVSASSHNLDESLDSVPHTSVHYQRDHSKPVPKNDIPNKFWLSVEPYCMPITNEDLKLLEDLLEQYSGPLVPPISDLGPHYSTVWAADDIKEDQASSNINVKSKYRTNSFDNHDVGGIIRKGEKLLGETVTGPLTQRLVSVLMEENLLADVLSNADSNSSSENINSSSNMRSMQIMKNGICLEKKLKKELIEQGILDPDDYAKNQGDEVFAEIKRVITELSAIAEYNNTEIRKLYAAAKEELKRMEVKRKLDSADQEIIETYKKVLVAKQKRRQLTNQERDDIYRLTEEQKKLSDQLEDMCSPGPNYVE